MKKTIGELEVELDAAITRLDEAGGLDEALVREVVRRRDALEAAQLEEERGEGLDFVDWTHQAA